MVKEHWNGKTKCHLEPSLLPTIHEILNEFGAELIIELGTAYGGFVKYLCEWYPEVPIYTVDAFWYLSKEDATTFRHANVNILITTQLFKNELTIPMLLSLPMKKFLFCDDGHKDIEVWQYAGYLRPGDLLGVHDWSDYSGRGILDALKGFDSHPINKELEKPGISDARFFIKRSYDLPIKPMNKTEHLWQ